MIIVSEKTVNCIIFAVVSVIYPDMLTTGNKLKKIYIFKTFGVHFSDLAFAEWYKLPVNERGTGGRGTWRAQRESNDCKERKECLMTFAVVYLREFGKKNARNKLFANEWQQGLEFVHLCFHLPFLSLACRWCPSFCWVVVGSVHVDLHLVVDPNDNNNWLTPLVNILGILRHKNVLHDVYPPLGLSLTVVDILHVLPSRSYQFCHLLSPSQKNTKNMKFSRTTK